MKRKTFFILFLMVICYTAYSQERFSAAGFFSTSNSERNILDFNSGWRFHRGSQADASLKNFNDQTWEIVNLPHTVELMPSEASGSRNYQGPAWYRKHFTIDTKYQGKRLSLYFEAIMGKSSFYVNGLKVKEHFGGFLPIVIDLTEAGVKAGDDVVIAVCADNSDDPSFPPGRKQYTMDFAVFGGIYRDCYFISTNDIHITDANVAGQTASGGVFVSYEDVSEQKAKINVKTHIANESPTGEKIRIETILLDANGKKIASNKTNLRLASGTSGDVVQQLSVKKPALWHPDSPNLHQLKTVVYCNGKVCDEVISRIGIRSIEFRGADGLYINGRPFEDKLMGVNRHQDYAYIGNAVPNNLHWLDVKKLRDAGCRIIRSAHYPQDPAFMDACDELGMFIIVATPGWQYWNPDPIFEKRIISDIRNMVRRDRNHPSVIMWEPILNETSFPESFALNAYNATHEEYPYPGCYASIDDKSKGAYKYDVIYTAPKNENYYQNLGKSCFTREFGDCVDDWNSHNSYSRVAREWGEAPQIRQAQHYARKQYEGSLTIDQFYKAPKGHIGGTLWHSFDHQRGYHPDPFWGGIMDAFRQPKYSYYMWMSQRDPAVKLLQADSGPMVYIANAMTPFSPEDIVVYSNCDSVRITINGKTKLTQAPELEEKGIRHPPIIFKNAYSFVDIRALHRANKPEQCSIVAEGFIGGKVVATTKNMPSKRNEKIVLTIDSGLPLQANGSDIVTVIASITDKDGHVKRLSQETVIFEVEGEGELIGGRDIEANPRVSRWGTAPALIRTTNKAGKVKVTARLLHPGIQIHPTATIEFTTLPADRPAIYKELRIPAKTEKFNIETVGEIDMNEIERLAKEEQERINEMKQVELQQRHFESTEKK
ncbi:glycoside hydrolase family 2 [Bacteroides salyersiae]|uniref:glycoside hydrolase family 2 TIM barrel-domain containing protein n=1 Tax=Bacteroides salyersiae TaxID=291644 RepID=UPI001C0290ED|nr:glycoside hydrolase family 2 TIM barrel-domain containing protein [Bacteroides salyersiae]MBT9875401.1 glycoside hydrolase family 2 [Bacteroides salyersiae]